MVPASSAVRGSTPPVGTETFSGVAEEVEEDASPPFEAVIVAEAEPPAGGPGGVENEGPLAGGPDAAGGVGVGSTRSAVGGTTAPAPPVSTGVETEGDPSRSLSPVADIRLHNQ